MKTTEEMIAVMQAYADGKKIEATAKSEAGWSISLDPSWNWYLYDYRVAPDEPMSIDWSALKPEWKYAARDANWRVHVFTCRPEKSRIEWYTDEDEFSRIDDLLSIFNPGTVDWKDSLIARTD